jgi:hypothetical protein
MGEGRRAFPHPSLSRARTGMTTPITNAYGDSCVYLQIGETCAAGRHIGLRNGSYGGTFSRVMCRYTLHRPQKCAARCAISVSYGAYSGTFRPFFDERTHDRTHQNPRNRRTNPGMRRTNPRFCKRTRGTTCRTRILECAISQRLEAFLSMRPQLRQRLAAQHEPEKPQDHRTTPGLLDSRASVGYST